MLAQGIEPSTAYQGHALPHGSSGRLAIESPKGSKTRISILPLTPEGDRVSLDALRLPGASSQLSSAHSCSTGLGTCLNARMAGSGLLPTLPGLLSIFHGSTWFAGAFSSVSSSSRHPCAERGGPRVAPCPSITMV